MSSIPTNLGSSIVGGVAAAGRAAEAKSKQDADQAKSADAASFADNLQNVIDDAETEMHVNADAEGAGSQGRPFSDDAPPADEPVADKPSQNGGGLDVEA